MRLAIAMLLAASPPASVCAAPFPASAETCGRCHRAIQEVWRVSAHANAMQSRPFQDALEAAEAEFGARTRRTCLECHSPLAVRSGDLALQR